MPKKKKAAAKLIARDAKLYAVLCPGTGYLKVDVDPYFYDNLPRASGCFDTEAEATEALDSTRTILRALLKQKTDDKAKAGPMSGPTEDAFDWFINQAQQRCDQAARAIVVELGFKPLGPWVEAAPPAPVPTAPSGPIPIRVSKLPII